MAHRSSFESWFQRAGTRALGSMMFFVFPSHWPTLMNQPPAKDREQEHNNSMSYNVALENILSVIAMFSMVVHYWSLSSFSGLWWLRYG